jgi:hypothetical protein
MQREAVFPSMEKRKVSSGNETRYPSEDLCSVELLKTAANGVVLVSVERHIDRVSAAARVGPQSPRRALRPEVVIKYGVQGLEVARHMAASDKH